MKSWESVPGAFEKQDNRAGNHRSFYNSTCNLVKWSAPSQSGLWKCPHSSLACETRPLWEEEEDVSDVAQHTARETMRYTCNSLSILRGTVPIIKRENRIIGTPHKRLQITPAEKLPKIMANGRFSDLAIIKVNIWNVLKVLLDRGSALKVNRSIAPVWK